jgi:endothelin-converting enzyme/putative endopeptidase
MQTMPMKMVLVSALLLLSFPTVGQNVSAGSAGGSAELPKLDRFSSDWLDNSANPCTDFYQYACGKWINQNPIPSDEVVWGTGGPLQLWNETILLQTLESASKDSSRTPNEQKIGDYYHSCMDDKTINAQAKAWLKPELDRINGMRTKSDIAAEVARLHQSVGVAWYQDDNQSNSPLFGFSGLPDYDDASHSVAQFDQGGMSLPGRSYYLDQDQKSKDIRNKYVAHVTRMMVLAGESDDKATKDAQTVLAMETSIAKLAMDPVTRRDPKNLNNKMSLAEVKGLAPSFDFDRYLKLVNAPASPHYIVTSPTFFKGVESMMQQYSLEDWKTYLRWQLITGNANQLSDDFVNESFDFYGKTLLGSKELQPRWRRCVQSTDAHIGEALGQAYVARAFPPENKARVLKMVEMLDEALSKDIDQQDWMTPETRQRAKEKMTATLNKIGYPDRWRDYSALQIERDNFLENHQRTVEFEFERWVTKIGKPVDRTEWTMTPPTINAYEEPTNNTINFPAGILQPPYFDMGQDDAANYGDAGAVIGHEITHGFDDQGRKFDAQGNLRDWWTPTDAQRYEAKGKCISDQYTQAVPEAGPGVKQDGRMTLGEDTADNGGTRIALMAFRALLAQEGKNVDAKGEDGLTPEQRFFAAYAFGWCSEYRPEVVRLLVLTNPHSFPKYRVNNVLSNMPEFAGAFGCHKGQPMVRDNACHVW